MAAVSAALEGLSWPLDRLDEGLRALARASGLVYRPAPSPPAPARLDAAGSASVRRWISDSTAWLGLEAVDVRVSYADVSGLLRAAAPALIDLSGGAARPSLLLLVGQRGRRLRFLAPDLTEHTRRAEAIRAALCEPLEARRAGDVERTLDEARIPPARRARVRARILLEQLGGAPVGGLWLLRYPPSAPFGAQARRLRLHRRAAALLGARAAEATALLFSWWLLGRGALAGRLDAAWMAAWILALATMLFFQLLATRIGGRLAVEIGALFKQRLLAGALVLDPEEIRGQGVGRLLGKVLDASGVEALAISGGLTGIAAALQLLVALGVLWAGAGGALHALLLTVILAASPLLGARYLRAHRRWAEERLLMTHDLVERLTGHRTRLVQEPRDRWHEGEDEALERYLAKSRAMDSHAVRLTAFLPAAWLCLGLLGMTGAFVSGSGTPASLAVSLGGVLLAYQSLRRLLSSIPLAAAAAVSWREIREIFHAAERCASIDSPAFAAAPTAGSEQASPTVMEAVGLCFRYPGRRAPALRDCSVRIGRGDRLLLEGPSGGGKSTLGAVIAGLRVPEAGLLLAGGLDLRTLGLSGWRERVVAAPQFHENHVLGSTFAFNLLMSRGWPAGPEDLREAEAVCRELSLGDLLDRMPAGIHQMVGETGWQLSHGERSRLYIARALLSHAELIVLDESFASLDPDTLRAAMRCVLSRARALIVIAHP